MATTCLCERSEAISCLLVQPLFTKESLLRGYTPHKDECELNVRRNPSRSPFNKADYATVFTGESREGNNPFGTWEVRSGRWVSPHASHLSYPIGVSPEQKNRWAGTCLRLVWWARNCLPLLPPSRCIGGA